MALTALQYVDIYAPSYAANANLSLYLQAAAEQMSTCQWGTQYNNAQALLACHMIALATGPGRAGGVGGAITSKTEGKLSISFGGGSSGGDLASTSFGMAYLRLQMASAGPALAVTGVSSVC